MAWRLVYTANLDFVGPGMGPAGSPQSGPGNSNAQTFFMLNQAGGQNVGGHGTVTVNGTSYTNVIDATDITTLTNAMAADIAAQMTTNLGRLQGFIAGQP